MTREEERSQLRWWTKHARLSFACLVLAVLAMAWGIDEHSPWVVLLNFVSAVLQVCNVMRCAKWIRLLRLIAERDEEIDTLNRHLTGLTR